MHVHRHLAPGLVRTRRYRIRPRKSAFCSASARRRAPARPAGHGALPARDVAGGIVPIARPAGPQQDYVARSDAHFLRLRGRVQMFGRDGEISRQGLRVRTSPAISSSTPRRSIGAMVSTECTSMPPASLCLLFTSMPPCNLPRMKNATARQCGCPRGCRAQSRPPTNSRRPPSPGRHASWSGRIEKADAWESAASPRSRAAPDHRSLDFATSSSRSFIRRRASTLRCGRLSLSCACCGLSGGNPGPALRGPASQSILPLIPRASDS